MRVETITLLTILGMALATYTTRAGGLWLMSRVKLSPRVEAWLTHLPGSLMMAIAAPMLLASDTAAILGVIATVLVAGRMRNMVLALFFGLGLVLAFRSLFGV